MIKVVIIEDEKLAAQNLANTLCGISDKVQIEAMLCSVAESIEYLSNESPPDIIFSDVQLTDGRSFQIFSEIEIEVPVIFTTAFDDFMMHAFEHNGIDYLLKPVHRADLKKALEKYEKLEKHFSDHRPAITHFARQYDTRRKSRLIVRRGMLHIALKLDEVVLFYTENKMVYAIDINRKQYIVESTLTELEASLDSGRFFRANRQYIININYIKCFKSFDKVKLLLDLNVPELQHTIVISQENCAPFKQWMYNA